MNSTIVFEKLLSKGLFPDKLDQLLTSAKWSALILSTTIPSGIASHGPFQHMRYNISRHNNAPRVIGIPHPIAYERLCRVIRDEWHHIKKHFDDNPSYNTKSKIRPRIDNISGRLCSISNSDKAPDVKIQELISRINLRFGARLLVKADISSCYNNIYSHSVPWAIVGPSQSKKERNDDTLWYNKIDCMLRGCQDSESLGIPIGPDTSAIISEIVLCAVDKGLARFEYIRHVDDYTFACKDTQEAESFIVALSQELEKFKLSLNQKKTQIMELPSPIDSQWIIEMRRRGEMFSSKKQLASQILCQ